VGFGFKGLSGVWIFGCSCFIVWVSFARLEPFVYTTYVLKDTLRFFINYITYEKKNNNKLIQKLYEAKGRLQRKETRWRGSIKESGWHLADEMAFSKD
jgi:hypothetical protein